MRALGVLVVGMVWWVASIAVAQGGDVVMLANGGRLRGTVEVYEPGADVVIVLSDGTRRTVPAADVAQVIFGEASSSAETPAVVAPPTPLAPVPPPTSAPEIVTPLPPAPAVMTPLPPAPPPPSSPPYAPPSYSGEPDALPGVQHLGAVESIAGVPEGTPRVYAPEDASSPWQPDPATADLPVGPLHFGLELRGGAQLHTGFAPGGVPLVGGSDLSFAVDYRVVPRFHLRVAAVLGAQSGWSESDLDGYYSVSRFGTGMGILGVRAFLGFDIGRLFILRTGGEFGGQYIPAFGRVEVYGAPEIDMLGQLTDGGNLEIGLAFSMVFSTSCRQYSLADEVSCSQTVGPRLQVLLGWVF